MCDAYPTGAVDDDLRCGQHVRSPKLRRNRMRELCIRCYPVPKADIELRSACPCSLASLHQHAATRDSISELRRNHDCRSYRRRIVGAVRWRMVHRSPTGEGAEGPAPLFWPRAFAQLCQIPFNVASAFRSLKARLAVGPNPDSGSSRTLKRAATRKCGVFFLRH